MEYVEAAAPIHQYLGEARGAHDQDDHERVEPQMRDTTEVIPLVEGDGRLGPFEPHWSGEGVNGVHLLLGDAVLPVGFIGLGAPEDHEAALGLRELGVLLLGTPC